MSFLIHIFFPSTEPYSQMIDLQPNRLFVLIDHGLLKAAAAVHAG